MTPDDLVEIELIKRLKYRYLRCLDQKLWDVMEGCFTPDATARYGGGLYEFDGRDAIMEFLRTSMGATTMLSSHRCHHPEIDLIDPTAATGVWALEDVVILTDLGINVQGAAFYTDRYVKVGDTWLIEHTGYQRTYEELMPRSSIAGLKLTADWWATGGRSTLG
jgi:SnoaL-like domain